MLTVSTESTAPIGLQAAWSQLDVRDIEGRRVTAAGLVGRVVVVDFWATWCVPCVAEMPRLRRLHESRRADGLEILGVSVDAIDRRALRSWLLRERLPWPQVHDGRGLEGPLAQAFEVAAVPATIVVDRQGRVVGRDLHGQALEELLIRLLGR